MNAGRDGSTTLNVAAIVRDEVVPLRPDLVIFYEGANGFDWGSVVENQASLKELPRPQFEEQRRLGGQGSADVIAPSHVGCRHLIQAGIVSGYVGERQGSQNVDRAGRPASMRMTRTLDGRICH